MLDAVITAVVSMSFIGTLPGWLTVFGIVLTGWFVYRGAGGTALNTLETANRILERRVNDLEKENHTLSTEVSRLRTETNVVLAVAPVIAALTQHETRAHSRHDATLQVLNLIADRLGPDPNNNDALRH